MTSGAKFTVCNVEIVNGIAYFTMEQAAFIQKMQVGDGIKALITRDYDKLAMHGFVKI